MSIGPPDWLFQWSQIIGAIGSLLLSGLLALLYKRQQEQLAADNKALLEVGSVEWDGDTATLKISNFGNGIATDLSLTTLAHSENDEHRKYTIKSNHLKRRGKSGIWSNTIQPSEEDVTFEGKSVVGTIDPKGNPRNWSRMKFSSFMREMNEGNTNEVKYLHVITGTELSGSRCHAKVKPNVRSINPAVFKSRNSLENLPSFKELLNDNTFQPYLHPTFTRRVLYTQYYRMIRFINSIPFVSFPPRPNDASGTRLVKRMVLRRKIRDGFNKIKSKGD